MKKILFIGSNPSQKSSSIQPFYQDTQSSRVLNSWLDGLICHRVYANVKDTSTAKNKPLSNSEIKKELEALKNKIHSMQPDKIVALGRCAAKALTLLQLSFYDMPHPSPRNRLLNNKALILQKIKGLELFIQSP
jgi:uracil-DNA glycosylase